MLFFFETIVLWSYWSYGYADSFKIIGNDEGIGGVGSNCWKAGNFIDIITTVDSEKARFVGSSKRS